MAYQSYPYTYQPYLYYPQTYQPYQQTQQTQQTQQIQNGGFVPVRNIEEARNYHVALGTSVTFIDENAPYLYIKTRGFSQLDQPVFEKLRLVKEEDTPQNSQNATETTLNDKAVNVPQYALKADMERIQGLYDGLRKEMDEIIARIGDGKDEL